MEADLLPRTKNYFVYDSQKLGQVRNFATSDSIQVMVINIDAFRKSFTDPSKEDKANIIHRPHDRMTGNRPIEFIQATNPMVIIDEPQSVDTTAKSRQAITSLNPLCTLRYSATHVDKHHMLSMATKTDPQAANNFDPSQSGANGLSWPVSASVDSFLLRA